MATIKSIQIRITDFDLPVRVVTGTGVEDFNVVKFTLVHPRTRTPEIVAVRQIPVVHKFADYLQGHLDGMLFKEDVIGDFHLVVEALAVDNRSALGKFLGKAFSSAATAGLGLATGGISSAVLSAFVGSAGEQILASMTDDEADTAVLGRGAVRLNEQSLAPNLTINLKAPQAVSKTIYEQPRLRGPRHRTPRRAAEELILASGANNGSAKFEITVL